MILKPVLNLLLITLFVSTPVFFSGCRDAKSQALSYVLKDIQATKTLVVGVAGDMAPFNMTTREGGIIGYEADLAQNFADSLGVGLRFEKIPFSELLSAVKTGKVHMAMSSITIVPQRNAEVAFIGPYFVSGKAFLTKEKRIAEATSLKKLDTPDVHLTALKGSTSQAFVEDGLSHAGLVLSDSYDEAVRMVLENKVHAMVADYPICAVSVLRYPGEGLLTEIMPLTYEPLGIALPPDDPHLLNWVENTLNILKGNGTLKAIEDRWFKDVSWLSRLP